MCQFRLLCIVVMEYFLVLSFLCALNAPFIGFVFLQREHMVKLKLQESRTDAA